MKGGGNWNGRGPITRKDWDGFLHYFKHRFEMEASKCSGSDEVVHGREREDASANISSMLSLRFLLALSLSWARLRKAGERSTQYLTSGSLQASPRKVRFACRIFQGPESNRR